MEQKYKILIVDDEKNTRDGLSQLLQFDYLVNTAENGQTALNILMKEHYDIVLTDLHMPIMDGLELTRESKKLSNPPLIIVLTAYGSVETTINALKAGAYDYITKPVNIDQLELMVERGISQLYKDSEKNVGSSKESDVVMIGASSLLEKVKADVKQIAPAKSTVLISGESGTGKELVAESLHKLSLRKDKPFIALHCAALNANLLESELFGHEKGAFTGAGERKIGRIEMANGGSLFLDEIGEIDLATQVKLLRVLESKTFERVGGSSSIKVDTRIICATNRDLKEEVKLGHFREDLYYRLSILNIHLPALRERKDDIELLLMHFLKLFANENNKQIEAIQPAALELLKAYSWPGNIRELRNLVERMVVMSSGGTITVGEIPEDIRQAILMKMSAATDCLKNTDLNIEENELVLIERALNKSHGNITHAAEDLGISRRTLQRKMKKYELRSDD